MINREFFGHNYGDKKCQHRPGWEASSYIGTAMEVL
jgi:hypothetical protein